MQHSTFHSTRLVKAWIKNASKSCCCALLKFLFNAINAIIFWLVSVFRNHKSHMKVKLCSWNHYSIFIAVGLLQNIYCPLRNLQKWRKIFSAHKSAVNSQGLLRSVWVQLILLSKKNPLDCFSDSFPRRKYHELSLEYTRWSWSAGCLITAVALVQKSIAVAVVLKKKSIVVAVALVQKSLVAAVVLMKKTIVMTVNLLQKRLEVWP